jgi:hypothetical protein
MMHFVVVVAKMLTYYIVVIVMTVEEIITGVMVASMRFCFVSSIIFVFSLG